MKRLVILGLLLSSCAGGDLGETTVNNSNTATNDGGSCKAQHGAVSCRDLSAELTCDGETVAFVDATCAELESANCVLPDRCEQLTEEG